MAKMKICKTCSKDVASSAKSCPNCGAKLKMGLFKKVLIGFVVLFAIGFIGSLGSKSDNKNTASAPVANQSAKAQTTALPEISTKEGISSDVKIVIDGVETASKVGDNQFTTKEAQGIFKIVKITLTNNQKDAITIDSNAFKLLDDKNREFTYSSEGQMALLSSVNNKRESFFLKQLNPGLSITGYIVYDVPKDAAGFIMKARGGMTGKEIKLKVE